MGGGSGMPGSDPRIAAVRRKQAGKINVQRDCNSNKGVQRYVGLAELDLADQRLADPGSFGQIPLAQVR